MLLTKNTAPVHRLRINTSPKLPDYSGYRAAPSHTSGPLPPLTFTWICGQLIVSCGCALIPQPDWMLPQGTNSHVFHPLPSTRSILLYPAQNSASSKSSKTNYDTVSECKRTARQFLHNTLHTQTSVCNSEEQAQAPSQRDW